MKLNVVNRTRKALIPFILLFGIFCVFENSLGRNSSAAKRTHHKKPAKVIKSSHTKESSTKLVGGITLRPTLKQDDGSLSFENSAELGIRFGTDIVLAYGQDFHFVSSDDSGGSYFSPVMKDGFAKLAINNIWVSENKLLVFSDEAKVYFPTEQTKRDAGMVTILRNSFDLTRKITDSISFKISETPIIHIYEMAGSQNAEGNPVANPVFENQLVFEMAFGIADGVTLVLPLKYFVTRFGSYLEEAEKNEAWAYFFGISPELKFSIGSHVDLGFKYNSGNFLEEADYGLILGDGLAAGAFQLSLGITF